MKNPVTYYGIIALGIIVLAVGIYLKVGAGRNGTAYAAIAIGVVIAIAGVVGMVVAKPKAQ